MAKYMAQPQYMIDNKGEYAVSPVGGRSPSGDICIMERMYALEWESGGGNEI